MTREIKVAELKDLATQQLKLDIKNVSLPRLPTDIHALFFLASDRKSSSPPWQLSIPKGGSLDFDYQVRTVRLQCQAPVPVTDMQVALLTSSSGSASSSSSVPCMVLPWRDITRSSASTAEATQPAAPPLGSRRTFPIYDRRQGLATDSDPCRTILRIDAELAAATEHKTSPRVQALTVYFYLGSISLQATLNKLHEGATINPSQQTAPSQALTKKQAEQTLVAPATADEHAYYSYAMHGINLVGDVNLARPTDYPVRPISLAQSAVYAMTVSAELRAWKNNGWMLVAE